MVPTLDAIREARERTRNVVRHTPLVPLHERFGATDVHLKLETLQPVGSFKLRGVFNAVAVLSDDERARGVSTVSAGNTAQALAWSARHFGVTARSLMPDTAPQTKVDAVRDYGGEPVLVPVTEVFRYLKEHGWESEPYAFIHPWTNPVVCQNSTDEAEHHWLPFFKSKSSWRWTANGQARMRPMPVRHQNASA